MESNLVAGGLSTLADGDPVPFDNIQRSNGAISYTLNSGEFVISETGYYLINWWVATDGAQSVTTITFDLQLNGITESQTASATVSGQVTGTSLIVVEEIPSTLELVNNTGANIFVAQTVVQADITIVRVSSLPQVI